MKGFLPISRSVSENSIRPIIGARLRRCSALLGTLCMIWAFLPLDAQAEDVSFDKTKYSSVKQPKEAMVVLTITDSKILIKAKKQSKKNPGPDIEIPFSSIDTLSYEEGARHRVSEGMGIMPISIATGAVVMSTKTKTHWLDIEYHEGDTKQLTILRLDKSQYGSVISTLQARTGKQIPVVDINKSAFNATAGSENMDEVVSFPMAAVAAAMKPAMENMGCKVTKTKANHLECKRRRTSDFERNGGGGEKVTAELEAKGEQTRVRIWTGKGYSGRFHKKNWSTPIYKEMLKNLKETVQRAPVPATASN
jgi:hypothetical protein